MDVELRQLSPADELNIYELPQDIPKDRNCHIGTQAIETRRLLLRKYEITDADDMFRNWVTDPEVCRFWSWEPHKNTEETKSLLLSWIDGYSKADTRL